MADLSQQLQLERDINSALAERNKLLESQRRTLSSQSSLAADLASSLGSGRVTGNLNNMNSALRSSASALKDTKSTAKDLESSLNDAADAAEEASEQTGLFGEALSSLGSIMGGMGSVLGAAASGILSIATSLAKVAFSIFTFPFKLFGSIVQMAQEGSGDLPIAKALEDLRDVLGDLSTGPAKAVRNTFDKISASNRRLGGTALTVRNIFGYGRDGMAALLKDLTELAAAAGDRISRLGPILERMGDKAIIFQRGLGLSKEEFADLIDLAEMRGEDPEKAMTKFSKTAVLTAKHFGLSTKDMAKGMKELMIDVENFGHLGPKAFAPITAYARKLGLEIKDMAGIMDKFSGFADSADAASKLGQVFQMAVDPMKLMAAQNPAEKIDMLRKAFFKAGKSLKDMTYQERKYLAQTTNLTGKSMEAAFALRNQGMGYEKIAAEAAEAEKKQLSQKEVLGELSKGIKKLIQALNMPKVKGFFDSFVKGFERGVMRSEEFRKVLRNIRHGLRHMFRFGMKIGRLFVKFFPGIKEMLEGVSDFLDPRKFKAFTKALGPVFKMFFEGKKSFSGMMDELQKRLTGQFAPKGLRKLSTGFLKFAGGVSKLLGGMFEYIFKIIRKKIIPFMTDVFKDAKKYVDGGKGRLYIVGIAKSIFKRFNEAIGSDVGGYARKLLDAMAPLGRVFGKGSEFQKMLTEAQPLMKQTIDMMGHDFKAIGIKIGCGIWEGIMYVWNNTTIWEKLLYGGGFMLLMAPAFMLKVGRNIGKYLFKGIGAAVGLGTTAALKGAQATATGGKAAAAATAKGVGSGMGLFRGAMVKRDMSKALKVAEAASKTAAMQKATKSAVDMGLKGAAKSSHTKKLFGKTYNNMMRTHRSNITRGTSKFLKTGTKQAIKESTKVATIGVKASTTAIKGVLSKSIPLIFDFAYGLYEAFNAKKGEGGQRFVAGVVSSLTFGVWSTDELQDAFFGTTSVIEKSSARTAQFVKRHQKKMYHHYTALAAAHKNVYAGLIEETNGLAAAIVATTRKLGTSMTDQQKKVFAAMHLSNNEADKAAKDGAKIADKHAKNLTFMAEKFGGFRDAITAEGLRGSSAFANRADVAFGMKGREGEKLWNMLEPSIRKKFAQLGFYMNKKTGAIIAHEDTVKAFYEGDTDKGKSIATLLEAFILNPDDIQDAKSRIVRGAEKKVRDITTKGLSLTEINERILMGENVGAPMAATKKAYDVRIAQEAAKRTGTALKGLAVDYGEALLSGKGGVPDWIGVLAKTYSGLEGDALKEKLKGDPSYLFKLMTGQLEKDTDRLTEEMKGNEANTVMQTAKAKALSDFGGMRQSVMVKVAEALKGTFVADGKTIGLTKRSATADRRSPGAVAVRAAERGMANAKHTANFIKKIGRQMKGIQKEFGFNFKKKKVGILYGYGRGTGGNRFEAEQAMELYWRLQAQKERLEDVTEKAEKDFVSSSIFSTARLEAHAKQSAMYGEGGPLSKLTEFLIGDKSGLPPQVQAEIRAILVDQGLKIREQVGAAAQKAVDKTMGTAAVKDPVATAAKKSQEKLSKLRQQQGVLGQIQTLVDVPKQVADAKAIFKKISMKTVERDATVMFTKALGIGKAIMAAMKASGIEDWANKKAEDSAAVKGVNAVANIIEPSVGALERIAGAARKLKEVIKKNLKFFKKLDLACLACEVYTMSKTAAALPKTLSLGMMPLLGKEVKIEGAETTETDTSKSLSQGMTDSAAAIVQLEKISDLVSSAATQFTTLAESITEINKLKVPSLSKKRRTLLNGMITTAFGMLGSAASAMAGGGLGGIAAALLGKTPVDSPKMLGKLTRATKNMEALGGFFKQAKKTGIDAASASRYSTSVKRNAAVMAEAVATIAEQGKSLNTNITAVVRATTAEGGGELSVTHTFGKKVELKVSVNIDTRELGNKLARVDVAGATDNPGGTKYYQIKTGGEAMVSPT